MKEDAEKLKEGKKIGIYEVIRTFKKEGIENFVITRKKYIETILNLIEKQQKEIDLCEETEIALNNRIMDLEEINKEHQKLNEELRKEIENLQNDNMEKDLMIDGLREERRFGV